MPKKKLEDTRYDFRGGRNTAVSQDLLNPNELLDSVNVRLVSTTAGVVGGVQKRKGTKRVHASSIGGGNPITAITQWDGPSGKQLVALSNGKLHYRDAGGGDTGAFTADGTAPFSTTAVQAMAAFRGSAASAALRLYVGDSTNFARWSGTTLTDLTTAGGALDDADLLVAYHTRLFAHRATTLKHVSWSKVGDAESFAATGLQTDAGTAMAAVLNGESIVAYEVVGSSLLIATDGGISRFTGYSTDDIRLQTDSEGLSSEVGVVGPLALKRVETVAAFLSKRGPYIATETGITEIGTKVAPDFVALAQASLSKAVVAYHKGRKEIWFAVSGASDSGNNKTIYVYSLALQAWSGPFTVNFNITSMTGYVRPSDSSDTIVAGCSDGFVRDLDIGLKDDVLSDGSAGSNFALLIEPAPHFFDVGPGVIKSLKQILFDADLVGGIDIWTNTDGAGFTNQGTTSIIASGVYSYRQDLDANGKRFRLKFTATEAADFLLTGYTLVGWDMERS